MQWAGNKKQIVKFDFKNVTKIFYLSSVVQKYFLFPIFNLYLIIAHFFEQYFMHFFRILKKNINRAYNILSAKCQTKCAITQME